MNKTVLYTAILLLSIIASCKSKYEKAADEILDKIPEGSTKNLSAGTLRYKMDIPKGWKEEHRVTRGVDMYYLMAPKTPEDPNTNINVIAEYMQNLSLAVFKAKTIESLKQAIPSAVITGEGDIEANGIKGGWYSFTMEPSGVKASLIGYIFPKDGTAYIVTAGTQLEDAKWYRSTFDAVAKSFRFVE